MLKKFVAVLGLFLALFLAAPGQAAQGLYLGTGLGLAAPNQSGDVLDEVEPETGFAWELIHLGYNFNENFGIGFQWGGVAGTCDWPYDHDLMWGQDYLTFSARYTFAGQDFEPYIELGAGPYVYSLMADDWDSVSDAEIGARIALGGNFNMGRLYIAPELSYHMVNYHEADVEDDVYGDYTIDFKERGDMLLFLFKFGYQFGG